MSAEGDMFEQNEVKKLVLKNLLEEKSELSDPSSSWDYNTKQSWAGGLYPGLKAGKLIKSFHIIHHSTISFNLVFECLNY